jgi:hypothetical protein
MRKLIAAALLATAAATPALADQRAFPVGGFDSLASSGPWTVRVHTGAAPSVHATGDKDVLDRLQIEVVGGELRIGSKPGSWFGGWHWNSSSHTRIDVTVPMLHSLTVSGPGDLTVDVVHAPTVAVRLSGPGDITVGTLDTKAIDIDLSGPGDIKLSGRAGNARVRLSGPGDIHGKALTVGDVDVHLSGPGTVTLDAYGHATGTLSGPGDIYLGSHAHCDIHKSGPGDVHCG